MRAGPSWWRPWRLAKWVLLAAGAMVFALAGLSGLVWVVARPTPNASVWVASWVVQIHWYPDRPTWPNRSPRLRLTDSRPTPPAGNWWFALRNERGRVHVAIPLWAPIALALLAGSASSLADSRYVRRRRNLCPSCAYDLRGLPANAPCPECGRAHATEPLPPAGVQHQ